MAVFASARPNPTRLRDLVLGGMLLYLLAQAGVPALRAIAQDGSDSGPRVPLANAFTYQGRLVLDGIPGDGAFDFEFAVYSAAAAGSPLGTGVATVNDLEVANGLFTAQLDFGDGVFTGDKRWLEVRVRPGTSTGAFTTLGRNELAATPYALFATSAPWSGISGIPSDIQDGDANTTYTSSAPISLQGTTFGLSTSGCVEGEVWKYDGANWNCTPDLLGAGVTFGDSVAGTSPWPAYGFAVTNTDGVGIRGETSTGYGLLGEATGDGYGIVGQTDSATTTAGWFRNDSGSAIYGRTQTGKTAIEGENFVVSGCTSVSPCVGGLFTAGGSGQFPLPSIVSANSFGLRAQGGIGLQADGLVGVLGTGSVYGVLGESDLIGVLGQGTDYGVFGSARGQGCTNVSSSSVADFCVGVNGNAIPAGPASIGVSGLGNWIGVRGEAKTAGGYGGVFIGKLFHSGAIETTSDARLKTNIDDSAGLDEVLALRPVSFNWTEDAPAADSLRHQGLLAQEVQQVLPDLVSEAPTAGVEANLALNYTELIPVLIRAIQDQEAEIDALKAPGTPAAATTPASSTDGLALALGLPMFAVAGVVVRRRRSQ